MNSTHISSKINKAKGKVKEEIGHAAGDESLAAKGVGDQVKAKIQEAFADAKDGVKKAVDKLLDRSDEKKAVRH